MLVASVGDHEALPLERELDDEVAAGSLTLSKGFPHISGKEDESTSICVLVRVDPHVRFRPRSLLVHPFVPRSKFSSLQVAQQVKSRQEQMATTIHAVKRLHVITCE